MYHVLNRANARMTIFHKPDDYAAFERVLAEAVERTKTRLLAYCLMPNHWHLVVWPEKDGELSRFTGWLTLTHTQRWHAHRHTTGSGHLYQGRFKSFPLQDDAHFFTVCRYVERNALRANLVGARGLAVGQPISLAAWECARGVVVGRLAAAAFGRLGGGGQLAANRGRVGRRAARSIAAVRLARPCGQTGLLPGSVWRARFAPKAGQGSRKTVPDTFSLPVENPKIPSE